MTRLWYTLITNKRKTFADVPLDKQTAVREMLLENGYDQNGDKITA